MGWIRIRGDSLSILKESATEDQHDQHLLYGVQTDLESLQYIDFVLQQPVVEFKQETCEETYATFFFLKYEAVLHILMIICNMYHKFHR